MNGKKDNRPEAFDGLRGQVTGKVVVPGDAGYEDARRVWNGMIDRRPAAVLRAVTPLDIGPAVAFARKHQLPIAVRGGGHSVAGHGTVDAGIVLDLGALTGVEVDKATGTVRVQTGATLADVDRATEPHGLAVPLGVVSGTGVAGLTLGGGFGWLTRAHGLSLDNLLSAEVVTASGTVLQVSETENPELFWGIRGGGGNFGIVSSFTFRAHPIPAEVFTGNLVYGRDRWVEALRAYELWSRDLPDALTPIVSFLVPPPYWEMGEDPLMVLGFAWADPDHEKGSQVIEQLRRLADPDAEIIEPVRWTAWQSAVDGLFPKGVRAYWKNTSFDLLDGAVIDVIARRAAEQTWQGTGFDIHLMGGAYSRVPEDATAFPDRAARFWLNIYGFWADPADDAARIEFVRGLAADMVPFASAAQYVNFMGAENGQDRRDQALSVYGQAKLERLIALKRTYDPENVFRLNHNILPG